MFQTVGHHAIDLYADALGLPLFRQTIEGGSVQQGKDYTQDPSDEVEDLYNLLKKIQVSFIHTIHVSCNYLIKYYGLPISILFFRMNFILKLSLLVRFCLITRECEWKMCK